MLRKLHNDHERVLTTVPYKDTPLRQLTFKKTPEVKRRKFEQIDTHVQAPRMELALLRNLAQQTHEQRKSWHVLCESRTQDA